MSGRLEELKEAATEQSGHGKSPVVIDGSRLLALIELVEAQHEALVETQECLNYCGLSTCDDCDEKRAAAVALYDKFNDDE